ncbi:MAG: RDD family protein [Campylobacterota bacterium]|nr:RDD family protein [Campylobacterota bacterium]
MVELDSLPIASSKKRVTAFVIDDLMVAFLFLIIFYDQLAAIVAPATSGVMSTTDMNLIESQLSQFSVDNLFIMLSIKILYHTIPVWQNGITLGKYLMKIQVINVNDGYKPSLMQALLRAVLRITSEVFFYLGFLMALFMPFKQTFHDKFSSCVVVDA